MALLSHFEALMLLLSLFNLLALLSHSQDVMGIVQAICNIACIFGNISQSHSLMPTAGEGL